MKSKLNTIFNKINRGNVLNDSLIIFLFFLLLTIAYPLIMFFEFNLDFSTTISFILVGIISDFIISISKRILSTYFLIGIFSYLMFFIAGFYHYCHKGNIWGAVAFNSEIYLYANILIMFFLVMIIFGYNIINRKTKENNVKNLLIELPNLNTIVILLFINILITIFLYFFVGLEYFSSRSGTQDNSILDFVFGSLLSQISMPILCLTLYYSISTKDIKAIIPLILDTIIYFLFNPITGITRSSLLVIAFILIVFFDKKFNNKFIFVLISIVGMFLIMPLMNYFKTFSTKFIDFTLNFAKPDFDAYEMLLTSIRYIEQNGYFYGKNILTAILFFVPRSLWSGKALNSGHVILTYFNSRFTNVSCPLVAEYYLSGGVLSVIILSFLTGILLKKIDSMYFSNSFLKNGALCCILGMFFVLFRGSLLQASVFTFALILDFLIVYFIIKLMKLKWR